MPIYEYECINCGGHVETLQRFSDKPLKKCKSCSGKLQRLISQSSFHLKGTGWYVTDYADKSKKSSDSAKSSSVSKEETKKESKAVSKKSEE
jgi:putative FmdB family regulatory protein